MSHTVFEQSGIVRIEITAADEATARRAGAALDGAAVWPTSGATQPYRVPGEEGMRVRLYANVEGDAGAVAPWESPER